LENELGGLTSRRTVLAERLARADADIERALSDRRRRLVEGDSDESDVESTPQLGQLRETRGAFADAIAALDLKIAETSTRIDQERDRARRETASRELTTSADALSAVTDEIAAAVAKIPGVLGVALAQLPHAVVSTHTVAVANEVISALRTVVSESRSHAAQIASGSGQICEPAAQPSAPPPTPPPIERQSVFLRYAGRWREGDEVKTCGPHVMIELPVEVARAALEFNHVVPFDSKAAADLRALQDPDYSFWPADRCADLTQPRPAPQPAEQTVASPVVHSGFTRQPIVGTAIAVR
jgi:hypothetical protein